MGFDFQDQYYVAVFEGNRLKTVGETGHRVRKGCLPTRSGVDFEIRRSRMFKASAIQPEQPLSIYVDAIPLVKLCARGV